MEVSPETREFIRMHRTDDVRDLALHAKAGDGVDLPTALEQIDGWQRARVKLPDWADRDGIIYPPHISMEQCSSQTTALYKASVARRLMDTTTDTHADTGPATGNAAVPATTLIDLTGGFGVDFSYMARSFSHGVYVERQANLCRIAEHNMAALGLENVTIVNADAESYLDDTSMAEPNATAEPNASAAPNATTTPGSTLIFLDPARRDAHGSRTYAIADCAPDVISLESRLLDRAATAMVKLSPMLDWHKAIQDLGGPGIVREVHIVSAGNECKELLIVLQRSVSEQAGIRMYCVNDGDVIDYTIGETEGNDVDQTNDVDTGAPADCRYVYEPNASIMKAGCFPLIERRYGVRRIGPNSHLFVSADPVDGFPGRGFAIIGTTGMNKRELRAALADITHANITVRNFPMPVAALRRKLRVKDGGDITIFATTTAEGRHILLIAKRITSSD
ncbi:THUMP-like domain-containing protein [Bifidobacterium margollesii]|uniref:THUMP-like domain-containing protein n=1 Tax=Bifidobacterium margollesii TaxID=2020964 RepID=UPI000C78E3C4|nr:class I SAM-dependent methyltransferase [Bifidobacterium margollesii]